jgi:hypothetical protein
MKPGDMVRGKPGCPNVGIVSIVTSEPYRIVERFGLEANVLMVDIQSFRNTGNWRAKCPVSFLEVVSEAR